MRVVEHDGDDDEGVSGEEGGGEDVRGSLALVQTRVENGQPDRRDGSDETRDRTCARKGQSGALSTFPVFVITGLLTADIDSAMRVVDVCSPRCET